jgi:hypothetical protein
VKAPVRVVCGTCGSPVALTTTGRLWRHGTPSRCPKSGRPYTGKPWRFSLAGRRIALTPGPDTYQPTPSPRGAA